MAQVYKVYNSAVPTTAAFTPVATGTAIKTLLQITAPSTSELTIISWGITFDGSPSDIKVELITTTTVAGGSPTAVTPTILAGTSASQVTAGFSPTSEGSIVATTKTFAAQILSAKNYEWEWSLGREPIVPASQVLRVRTTSAASVNALCWVCWQE